LVLGIEDALVGPQQVLGQERATGLRAGFRDRPRNALVERDTMVLIDLAVVPLRDQPIHTFTILAGERVGEDEQVVGVLGGRPLGDVLAIGEVRAQRAARRDGSIGGNVLANELAHVCVAFLALG